jgi:hypothetical protein
MGTEVLVCPDFQLMTMMDNKELTYKSIGNHNVSGNFLVTLPEYYIVSNLNEFKESYETLKSKGLKVCFKPVIGEGANGFRVVKEDIDSIVDLLNKGLTHNLPYSHACEILGQQDSFPPLMVMEYLDGPEYSIDCLADDENLYAAIPRKKGKGRVRELENNPELMAIAEKIHETYRIPFIFNIQVKYQNGVPKLLELNPRMSGGLHITCLSGVNFPYLSLKILLNETIKGQRINFDVKASYLEEPVLLA